MLERERKIHLKISKNQTLQANRHLKKGNLAEAIDHYRMALKYGPANLEARIGLSECYIKKGEYDEAKKRLSFIFENEKILKPKNKEKLKIYALLIGIDELEKNLENNSNNDIKNKYKNLKRFENYYKKLLKDTNSKEKLVYIANLHMKWNDISTAKNYFELALKKDDSKLCLDFESKALIGLAWILYKNFKITNNRDLLFEAEELVEKAIDSARRSENNNKELFYRSAEIKSNLINNNSVKFHIVYQYLENAVNIDPDFIEARFLRAKIILDHHSSPYQSPFYYRTAARDLMKIASLKPSEENVRKAYEVSSKIDWRSAERLKKQLDKIIFFKNRKKVFVAEVLDDMEERERIVFWNKTKKELQNIKEEDFSKNKTSIMKARSMIEKRIIKDLKGRNELSEEEVKYLYLNQVLHLSLGNIETAVDMETSFFNYPDQEHFIVTDAYSYIGKIEDIIQDENSKNAKRAYDNHREFHSSNQISYNNFKPLELDESEIIKILNFLDGKGGTKYLSKKNPQLNIIKPKRTMKVKKETIEKNPQAIKKIDTSGN